MTLLRRRSRASRGLLLLLAAMAAVGLLLVPRDLTAFAGHGGMGCRDPRSVSKVSARAGPSAAEMASGGVMNTQAIQQVTASGPDMAEQAKAFQQMPGGGFGNDLFGQGFFGLIIPAFVGVFIVYLALLFAPEAVLSKDQVKTYKEIELESERKKRGYQPPKAQSRRARRKKLREELVGKE